ncbi:glutathione peroxidase [Boudabousia liubingyangii]|uniref:Glutathione peroxidase n=1 Tax=Boudabousia liubingyangii TaxID=1921764 RepID=A0A1Q5PLT2_9ACTO|nr:glutathione peroxidase [Boudabousia liubingyangii]OKL46891.1 glutathione peroxidase [Boudabousia liubingyangii]OKL48000.1 glutathione peroxidase [Boudabousia liubingyangii]
MSTFYDFSATALNGSEISMSDYQGLVVLVVNTASKCGFTPQLEELQQLHEQYFEQGLRILGFPCNQFGKQEPGSSEEISEFCQLNYGVQFQMFQKIDVNGADAHPLWKWLRDQKGGILGDVIKWNFTKFLIGRNGEVADRFAPTTKPSSLTKEIESLLNNSAS